jgi:hypothetical protein
MNTTWHDGSNEGAFAIEGVMPDPWPPASVLLLRETKFSDGVARLTAEPDGRFHLALVQSDNRVLNGATCEIEVAQHREFALVVTWSIEKGRIGAAMNGALIASIEDDAKVAESYTLSPRHHRPAESYQRRNVEMISKRRGRYKGWQPRPNRIAASEAHIASELAARRRQLSDLLRAVEGGASYHISGVANLLRLLIATGEPLPHLQLVAAAKDLPLIVYTERNPTVFAGAYEDLSFAIWPRPTDRNDNPIDLDVWLDLPAGRIAGKPVTHRHMLTKIGDTIGSHFDVGIHFAVAMLTASESGISGTTNSLLIQYLTQAGGAVAELIEATLSKA